MYFTYACIVSGSYLIPWLACLDVKALRCIRLWAKLSWFLCLCEFKWKFDAVNLNWRSDSYSSLFAWSTVAPSIYLSHPHTIAWQTPFFRRKDHALHFLLGFVKENEETYCSICWVFALILGNESTLIDILKFESVCDSWWLDKEPTGLCPHLVST